MQLYADRSYLEDGQSYVPLLYPFWGELPERKGSPDRGRFTDYIRVGHDLFRLVSPNKADALLLPGEWQPGKLNPKAYSLSNLAKQYNKPVIIFCISDLDEGIPIDNAIVFRTALQASKRKPNEFGMPAWQKDLMKTYCGGRLPFRDKPLVPTVGYTGYVDYKDFFSYVMNLLRRLMRGGQNHKGAYLRGRATRLLARSSLVKTVFTIRDRCLTGAASFEEREVFIRNIVDADYSLVARGGGNFSYRLYEVLCLGRIPLFVDSDCVLPFDHLINWKKYCLWVDEMDIGSIAKLVSEFHSSLSACEFLDLQRNARKLYEEYLSPSGFYSNICRCMPGDCSERKGNAK
ncbi:exostosin family protein [Verrucomicrobiota bacterium]